MPGDQLYLHPPHTPHISELLPEMVKNVDLIKPKCVSMQKPPETVSERESFSMIGSTLIAGPRLAPKELPPLVVAAPLLRHKCSPFLNVRYFKLSIDIITEYHGHESLRASE